jgi:hypothetical protein
VCHAPRPGSGAHTLRAAQTLARADGGACCDAFRRGGDARQPTPPGGTVLCRCDACLGLGGGRRARCLRLERAVCRAALERESGACGEGAVRTRATPASVLSARATQSGVPGAERERCQGRRENGAKGGGSAKGGGGERERRRRRRARGGARSAGERRRRAPLRAATGLRERYGVCACHGARHKSRRYVGKIGWEKMLGDFCGHGGCGGVDMGSACTSHPQKVLVSAACAYPGGSLADEKKPGRTGIRKFAY